mgnify:CR=1 FL=1
MAENIPIAHAIRIRECGFDEFWLQDQIVANPSCLGLGELEVITRERQQASGGRLDILLKDPEDDSMYEVEVMLGETDETHIIRTIEYWDNEKRRWPQRQHFAVLVAESITRRFFNVIQVLSHAIPMIAIQANIVEANGQKMLTFAKILDTYEEPEEGIGLPSEVHDETYWREKAAWTMDAARALLEIVRPVYGDASLNYVKNYIGIMVNGNNYFWFHKRSGNKSLLNFWLTESLLSSATKLLDEKGIPYTVRKNESIRITIDKETISNNPELFIKIAQLVRQAWEE